jgi:hypothetical protein
MKPSLAMILLVSLLSVGCNPENTFQDEQCSPEFATIVEDPTTQDKFIPVKGSVCRCRQYRIDLKGVGPVRNPDGHVTVIDKPIQECNLIKGYKPKADTKLVNMIDWWRVQINKWLEDNQSMDAAIWVEGPGHR